MSEMSEKDEEKKTSGLGKSIRNSEEAGACGCAKETVQQV